MALPGKRIRVVAGTPIDVGDRRLLPSVLVTTVEGRQVGASAFRSVRMRPISLVIQAPDGAQWQEIPNTTDATVSSMVAIGAAVAGIALLLLLLIRWARS